MLLVGPWAVATTVVAVLAGVFAVSTVGATIRDRGPVGDEVARDVSVPSASVPEPEGPGVSEEISGSGGRSSSSAATPGRTAQRASAPTRTPAGASSALEKGPDDDVDAVFSDGRNSVDLEVFCNRGRPTLAELERNTLGED